MITEINFKNEIILDAKEPKAIRRNMMLSNNIALARRKLQEANVPEGSTFNFTARNVEEQNGKIIDIYVQKFSITV